MAAAVIGFVIYGWGGLGTALTLLLFFTSASVLTRFGAASRATDPGRVERASSANGDLAGRGALQVLVNGAVPAVAVLGFSALQSPGWSAAFAGALAAVTADTWATEIGKFSPRAPILITTGKRVLPGRSGAISLIGTLGGLAGALVLAAAASAAGTWGPNAWRSIFIPAVVGGIIGLFADSLLGATVQAGFHCDTCEVATENLRHRCGNSARHVVGLRLFTNDTVNFMASLIGALTAAAFTVIGGLW